MDYLNIIVPFAGGLGMFIYGMQIMAQGLENAAGNKMKFTMFTFIVVIILALLSCGVIIVLRTDKEKYEIVVYALGNKADESFVKFALYDSNNKNIRIDGATPKDTKSARESNSFPKSLLTCRKRAILPSYLSTKAAAIIKILARP